MQFCQFYGKPSKSITGDAGRTAEAGDPAVLRWQQRQSAWGQGFQQVSILSDIVSMSLSIDPEAFKLVETQFI